MKYTTSLFSVLALVGTLTLTSPSLFADEVKTVTSSTSAAEITSTPRVIGKVSYLLGQADMILPNGAVIAITKKTEILEGSKISVKDRSKLNLSLVDGATEKLAANSTLAFTQYRYDPADPKGSEIRKELIEGEVTSKTGVGGKEAKERYRLNSPLAAIAVLGTEYTVSISGGETRIVVMDGIISMAKLGGSCQRSGLGACADGEQLMASQRGLALVVRKDQPRPVLIPASTPPPVKSAAQTTSAQEQAEEEAADKKAAEEAAAKEKESKLAADKKAAEDAAAAKEKESKLAADKKAAEDAAAAKEKESKLAADDATAAKEKAAADKKVAEAKKVDKQESAQSTEPAPAKTSETVAPVAEKPTDKVTLEAAKKVDERDPLAEVKVETNPAPITVAVQPKTPAVVESVVPVAKTPEVVAVAPTVASNLESTQPSGLNVAVNETTPPVTAPPTTSVLTPIASSSTSNPMILVSAGSSGGTTGLSTETDFGGALLESFGTGGSALLESATGSALTGGGLITTPLGTPLVATTDLVESSSKTESTVTTDTGQVIAAVTPPPVVVTPIVTPTPETVLPPVRWGLFDPATVVDGVTLADQVSSQYAQVIAATTANAYTVERLKTASASLPEQRDVGFVLGSYAANVRNATTGTATAATVTDATLNVSSVRNTFDTGFTLNSPVYTGTVKATGTYSATDGILKDDGTNPQTTLNGAVGVLGDTIGAAYSFNHQIDTVLSADGALGWTGTASAATTPLPSVGTTLGN